MESNLRLKLSRYMSYLLRHNPENLKMDRHGFVDINELLKKLKKCFQINKKLIIEIVEKSERRKFEIVGNKIRAR